MFWGKKNSKKNKKTDKRKGSNKAAAGCVGKEKGHGKLTRDQIHAEAMANFSSAKANIGEDTLHEIATIMARKENSPMEQARRELASVETDKVLDELKWMMDQKD